MYEMEQINKKISNNDEKIDETNPLNIKDFFTQKNKNLESLIPNSKQTKFYFGKVLSLDRLILLFSILSLFLGEFEFKNVNIEKRETLSRRILIILMVLSLFLCIILVAKYFVVVKYYKIKKILPNKKKYLSYEDNLIYALQFIILLSHSSPFWYSSVFSYTSEILQNAEIIYKTNSIFHFISLFKIFIIFKLIIFNTLWASDKSFRICRMYGCKNNFMFVIRCLMKEKPILFVFYTLIGGILFFGGAQRIVEGSYIHNFDFDKLEFIKDSISKRHDYLLNCYWEVIITMTTVGYGDIFPRTYPGRLVIVICSIFGITVVSLMVVSITNTLEMDNIESKSYIVIKKLIYKCKMEEHAAFMISILAKNKHLKKKREKNRDNNIILKLKKQEKNLKNKFQFHSNNFKIYRRIYKSIVDENIIEEIDRMNGILNEKLEIIKNLLKNPENKNIKEILNKINTKKTEVKRQKRVKTKISTHHFNQIANNIG